MLDMLNSFTAGAAAAGFLTILAWVFSRMYIYGLSPVFWGAALIESVFFSGQHLHGALFFLAATFTNAVSGGVLALLILLAVKWLSREAEG